MATVALQEVVQAIQNQLPALGRNRFTIDQRLAEIASNQFMRNYNRNWYYSKSSSLVGLVSFIGLGFSLLISSITAIAFASIGFALWVNIRNWEGYALQNALNTKDEDEIIQRLSLGANIYQKVWPSGGAAANIFPTLKGRPRTVMQTFAEAGYLKVVAYLAMLEPDVLKRTQMATDTLPYAADKSTAQLLLDLGANIQEIKDVFFLCCLKGSIELVQFFVEAGAKLDAGISDYERWQTDLDQRQRDFVGNWYPGNNEGVSPTLYPSFKTPIESLLAYTKHDPISIFTAMQVKTEVYQNKNSVQELYHSLNQAGVRIRYQQAEELFQKLSKTSTKKL